MLKHGWLLLLGVYLSVGTTGSLSAAYLDEVESNDTLATAQSLDGYFDLTHDENIGNRVENTSTRFPHASVRASGNSTFDYFSFTVNAGVTQVIFDIDAASTTHVLPFDPKVFLFSESGVSFGSNDNALAATDGALGSLSTADSYLEVSNLAPGRYVVGVARDDSLFLNGKIGGSPPKQGDVYMLHVTQVPEPGTLAFGLAGLGLGWVVLRRR